MLDIFAFSLSPEVLSEKRDMGAEMQNHIRKYLPSLRASIPGLSKCADWLEAWIDGTLPPVPLLEVDAFLAVDVEVFANWGVDFQDLDFFAVCHQVGSVHSF